MNADHPVRFSVDYPDRPLDRLSTAFRIFTVIPIAIVIASIGGYTGGDYDGSGAPTIAIGGTGLLFLPPLLMILFREKYPRWWFDWNLELLRFTNRVGTYVALMSDRYPSTDERQWVQLDIPYPDARRDLNRWLPLVKWFLAIPHYIVLFFLYLAMIVVVIGAWFAILFTGRYPRGIFDFVEGVIRWHNRVVGYAFILVTDRYPPFSMSQGEPAPPAAEGRPKPKPEGSPDRTHRHPRREQAERAPGERAVRCVVAEADHAAQSERSDRLEPEVDQHIDVHRTRGGAPYGRTS